MIDLLGIEAAKARGETELVASFDLVTIHGHVEGVRGGSIVLTDVHAEFVTGEPGYFEGPVFLLPAMRCLIVTKKPEP